jgi:thymidylate synthase
VDVPPARVINPAFAAAEAAWILSGSDDPWIYLYNERPSRVPRHPAGRAL